MRAASHPPLAPNFQADIHYILQTVLISRRTSGAYGIYLRIHKMGGHMKSRERKLEKREPHLALGVANVANGAFLKRDGREGRASCMSIAHQ